MILLLQESTTGTAQEAAAGMSLAEILFAVLAIIVPSILTSIAIYYGRRGVLLTQEQSERRPELEVSGANLHSGPVGDADMRDKIRLAKQARATEEDQEEGLEEEDPFHLFGVIEHIMPIPDTPSDYKGPLPDAALRVEVINVGKIAATEIMGWLHFDANHLWPIRYFNEVENIVFTYGFGGVSELLVRVGGDKESTLFPTPRERNQPMNELVFYVNVAIAPSEFPVQTTIRYEFITRTGESTEGSISIEIRNKQGDARTIRVN